MMEYFNFFIIGLLLFLGISFKILWNRYYGVNYSKLKKFTFKELSKYDGIKSPQVYMAVNTLVFDVTKSNNYGPNCTYSMFAGHDATVSLGKMSFDTDLLDTEYSNMDQQQTKTMLQWFDKFKNSYKYPVVGCMKQTSKEKFED